MKIKVDWKLPPPPLPDEEWLPCVRLCGGEPPWGYKEDPEHPEILLPIPEKLDVYRQALKHLKKYSYQDVANWLSDQTGDNITREKLRDRVKRDAKFKKQAKNARKYAIEAEKAARKAAKLEAKLKYQYRSRKTGSIEGI